MIVDKFALLAVLSERVYPLVTRYSRDSTRRTGALRTSIYISAGEGPLKMTSVGIPRGDTLYVQPLLECFVSPDFRPLRGLSDTLSLNACR